MRIVFPQRHKGHALERVDAFLQDYRPHVSGLTNMAAENAEHAARAGYDVQAHCVSRERGTKVFELNGVTVHAYRKSLSVGR